MKKPDWRELFVFKELVFDRYDDKYSRFQRLERLVQEFGRELDEYNDQLPSATKEQRKEIRTSINSVIIFVADLRWQMAYLRYEIGQADYTTYIAEIEQVYTLARRLLGKNPAIETKVAYYRRLVAPPPSVF
ncbi:MAG: hypothetical protein A2Z24_01465 [Candidatus Woykebacteria bacterium RBG_16_44_10]|uniref:Uncharacterized protein n=1 Tax=Candidatus Woykebacteria bacterium RBG_16_44_10 TaxID=1802597 RepID=A0A1G1WEZ2_9BACT|nr:MAG: hypothetical protein A2Z24_01465 [Candidatus Woykebacteria bacterium RBG_16_44_10]